MEPVVDITCVDENLRQDSQGPGVKLNITVKKVTKNDSQWQSEKYFIEKIKNFYSNLLVIWNLSEKSNTEVSLIFFSYLLVWC